MAVIALLLAAAAPGAAQAAVAHADIVVTGRSLDSTRRALEACVARRCSAEEDIAATLAHAENLFVAGDYEDARAVLRKSIGRNGDEARRLPVPVSYLYRANGRVAAHLGEREDFRSSTYRTHAILKDAASVPVWQKLAARLEVANMIASTQGLWAGKRAYLQLADEADRLGRPDFAAIGRLKAIWADYKGGRGDKVEKELWRLAEEPSPAARQSRLGALILLARIEHARGGTSGAAADALVRELAAAGSKRPSLLYAPAIPQLRGDKWNSPGAIPTYSVLQSMATENFDDRWADIAFRIQPDGRVADVDVIRESGNTSWIAPVLTAIGGRIYAPLAEGQSAYRVERFTYTSNWRTRIDTRMRTRSPEGVIHSLDLTIDPPKSGG